MKIDLKGERLNRGLSLDALAKETGVAKSTLARVEGGGVPSARNAFAIASFFGYEVTEIWPMPEEARA